MLHQEKEIEKYSQSEEKLNKASKLSNIKHLQNDVGGYSELEYTSYISEIESYSKSLIIIIPETNQLQIGDRVKVREKIYHPWRFGVVKQLSPIKIQVGGMDTACEWNHIQHPSGRDIKIIEKHRSRSYDQKIVDKIQQYQTKSQQQEEEEQEEANLFLTQILVAILLLLCVYVAITLCTKTKIEIINPIDEMYSEPHVVEKSTIHPLPRINTNSFESSESKLFEGIDSIKKDKNSVFDKESYFFQPEDIVNDCTNNDISELQKWLSNC